MIIVAFFAVQPFAPLSGCVFQVHNMPESFCGVAGLMPLKCSSAVSHPAVLPLDSVRFRKRRDQRGVLWFSFYEE